MAAIFQLRRGSGSIDNTIVDGELYVNKGPDSLQYSVGDGNPITLAKLDELNTGSLYLKGGISASGDITASNAYFSGDVAISGNLFLGNNSSDNISALGVFTTNLNAGTTNTYNIGSTSSVWANIYANNISASSFTGSLYGMGDPTTFSQSVDNRLDRVEASSSLYDNAMSGSKRLYVSPSGSDSNDGSDPSVPFRTIKAAVEYLGSAVFSNVKRYTIFVGSGEYVEQNPIALPPGVAIVGDTLRTVRLTAANPTKDYFHCHDGNYFYGLRFLNLQNPSFCFSYPCSAATASISAGGVSSIGLVHSMTGYTDGNNQNLGIIIEGPDVSGSIATATANVVGGVITQINVVSGGTNYSATEKPHISIPAPESKRPVITTSPYVQNCSSITGPFTTDGTLLSPVPGTTNYAPLPYNINDVRNESNAVIGSGVIDEQGAGGGIRIDGNLVHPASPLESFVADAFTQVNQGGPGHLVINKGYAQFVSCFTTFCTYGFKTANGGFANVSNSVIDFGKYGLVSKTYFPTSYNTATSSVNLSSYLASIQLDENGAGYTGSFAGVVIYGGGASVQAIATASVDANGSIREIIITNSGSGYTSKPTVDIDPATGPGAINATTIFGKGEISNIGQIPVKVTNITRGIDISSNMVLDGQNYLVVDVSGSGADRLVSILNTEFHPAPASITSGSILNFHQLSNISTGNIVMEYVGSGITYNALPKFGGIPLRTREINEFAPGRVFYTSVDNIGNLKIGDYFSVNQLTGEVSITSDSFNLTGLNAIGPFRRNGFDAGVILQEVSNNTNLLNSVGLYGEDTVPTQFAVKGYIDIRDAKLNKLEISSASLNLFSASVTSSLVSIYQTTASLNISSESVNLFTASVSNSIKNLNEYTASLKDAISVSGLDAASTTTIKGDLIVNGTTTAVNSTTIQLGDNIIELNGTGIANGGLLVKDPTGAFTISGSLLWDSTNDYWKGGAAGNESKFLLAGGDGVLSGSTDFNAFSTSVHSRLSNLEITSASVSSSIGNLNSTTASLNISVSNLNVATASLYTSASLMTASISSLTSSVVALQAFSGNVNNRFAAVQTHTTSVNSRFEDLAIYTGSVNSKFTEIGVVSSSLILSASLVSSSVWHLHQFSSSQLEKDLTLAIYTGSVDGRFTSLATISGSLILSASAVSSSVWNLHQFSASINFFSSSTFTEFSNSYDAVSESFDYRISILDPGNLDDVLLGLNAFTSSANIRLNNIEAATSSYETKGRGIVSGSQQVIDLLPTGVISGSIQILGGSGVWSSSLQMPAGVVSGAAQLLITELDGFADYNDGIMDDIGGKEEIASATHTLVSGSSQVISLLPSGVISGSSQLSSVFEPIASATHTLVSGSLQILGGSSIHSSSVGNYQFNSIGVGLAATGVAGEIVASADIVAFSSSDIRLKENIVPIPNALEKVNQISGNTYDWKAGYDEIHSHKGNDVGVIAQEIEEILPQIVTNRDNGYKAVQYEKIIPLLVEAIKELSAKIDRLENK